MATYIRLTDYKSSDEKEQEFFKSENRYEAKQEDFSKIPASPIAYWVSSKVNKIFATSNILKNIFTSGGRIKTHNNELYVRNIWEVEESKIKKTKEWKLYENGGESLKWYGNKSYVVNWTNSALQEYKSHGGLTDSKYWNREGITWSIISTNETSFRIKKNDSEFSSGSPTIFIEDEDKLIYTLSILNSKFYQNILKITAPTVNTSVGDVLRLPIIFPKPEIKQQIETLTQQNINISKEEWDSRETSWDFTKNELIKHKSDSKIESSYSNYCNYWKEQFNTLHQNEEELNRIFIDIYELQDELTPDVELKDITILKNETKIIDNELVFQADEIMKQFISYGVGVMFGRYSLDHKGLHIANMDESIDQANSKFNIKNSTFEADDDNVIPVLEDDYFKDDIASRFVQFVKATFGEKDLSENIRFIESSLGTTLRKYFVKGFYEDHIKRYKKRPIYWMVASPKKGFMSLIYMHRYKSDVFATVQNSYLREYITKLEASRENYQREADDASNSNVQRNRATKEVEKINKILDEVIKFDREVLTAYAQNAVEIDLDDGVKVNYCKFKAILYEIKGLCK